jgi:hypothetical protein
MIVLYDKKKIGTYVGVPSLGFCAGMAKTSEADIDVALISMSPETPGEKKALVRQNIEFTSGDDSSILGTTADGMQILLHAFSGFIVKLNNAQSMDEVRASTNDFAPIAQAFLTKVDTEQVKLPFNVRGLDETMDKIEQRATAVANAMMTAQPIS